MQAAIQRKVEEVFRKDCGSAVKVKGGPGGHALPG